MVRVFASGAAFGAAGVLVVSLAALLALKLAEAVGLAPPVGDEESD
jgi:hypothetical protein